MADIQVTSGSDKPTARQQIAAILKLTKGDDEVKLRIPVTIFDPADKNYTPVREAYWMFRMPAGTSLGQVEGIIEALGKTVEAIGELGAERVIELLTAPQGESEQP